MVYGLVASVVKTKATTGIGGFISGIFKKPRYAKWKGKGFKRLVNYLLVDHPEKQKSYPSYILKILKKKSITAKEKKYSIKWIGQHLLGWNKDMRKDILNHFKNYKRIKSEPKKIMPVESHKVSASYKPEAKTKVTTKIEDTRNAMPPSLANAIPKTPLYILIGAGALFLIFNLTKIKGGVR